MAIIIDYAKSARNRQTLSDEETRQIQIELEREFKEKKSKFVSRQVRRQEERLEKKQNK